MKRANLIKTSGYGVSVLSVILLAAPSWKNATREPMLMLCVLLGMAASIIGMGLRWWSYQEDPHS